MTDASSRDEQQARQSCDAVVRHLQESHESLNGLLAQLREARQPQEQAQLVNKLCTRIGNLITERQELIYPGVDSSLLIEIVTLNRHAQQLIGELHALKPGELAWEAKSFALQSYVRTLIEREYSTFLGPNASANLQLVCAHFERRQEELQKGDKVVEKSSKDSFPASDPPASQQFDIPENSLTR